MSLSEVSSALYKELNTLIVPPLINPRVEVNSYTPYDKEKSVQEVFTRESFRVERPESKLLDFSENEVKTQKIVQETEQGFTNTEFPPDVEKYATQNNINNNIVQKSLNNGYSAQEAVNIKSAIKNYSVNESFYNYGNNYISTQSCSA